MWHAWIACVAAVAVGAVAAPPPEPLDPPTSIVDILSANVQFLTFLRQLQRNGLVPYLNSLGNVTLLAPVNLAFAATGHVEFDWDNNALLRYILVQPVSTDSVASVGDAVVYYSHYNNCTYPLLLAADASEYTVDRDAAIVEPNLYALHQDSYIHGLDSLLALKPTMCQFLQLDVNHVAGKSIALAQRMWRTTADASVLAKPDPALPQSCEQFMGRAQTLLLPTDAYLGRHLLPLQIAYYTSLSPADDAAYEVTKAARRETRHDTLDLLANLVLPHLAAGVNATGKHVAVGGKKYLALRHQGRVRLADVESVAGASDIVLADGVLHLFNEGGTDGAFFGSLVVPTPMIPRRALYALHFSHLVEEYYFRKLHHLIDGSTANQTLIVNLEDRDDVPEDDVVQLHTASFSAKQHLSYQALSAVVPANVASQPKYHLVDTELCLRKRIGGCLKAKVCAADGGFVLNDDIAVHHAVSIANALQVWLTREENRAPGSLKHLLVELILGKGAGGIELDSDRCLEMVRIMSKLDLFDLKEEGKGYTVFMPCGKASALRVQSMHDESLSPALLFGSRSLLLRHLSRHPGLLKSTLGNIFLRGTVYSDFDGNATMRTLKGDHVMLRATSHQDHTELKLNSTTLQLRLNSDILFNQGVLHVTSELLLPDDLVITMPDLIRATYENEPINFGSLLEVIPHLLHALLEGSDYSALVPTAESLAAFNITADFSALANFIQFHLIDNRDVPSLLACLDGDSANSSIHTNYSSTSLSCRITAGGKTYLLLEPPAGVSMLGYNKDHEVAITSYGCTRAAGHGGNSCVFVIDKPLNLKWLERPSGDFLHVTLGIVSVGVGIVLGLVMFGAVMIGVAMALDRNKKPPLPKLNGNFAVRAPSFMSVRDSSDDNAPFDQGYETDNDMVRSDHELLLPKRNRSRRRTGATENSNEGYGSTKDSSQSPNGPTGPLPISTKSLTSTLNRDRHLPSVV